MGFLGRIGVSSMGSRDRLILPSGTEVGEEPDPDQQLGLQLLQRLAIISNQLDLIIRMQCGHLKFADMRAQFEEWDKQAAAGIRQQAMQVVKDKLAQDGDDAVNPEPWHEDDETESAPLGAPDPDPATPDDGGHQGHQT
jgi:hypothetical protein